MAFNGLFVGNFMELKIAFLTSLLCVIVGLGLIVGAAIAYPLINKPITNLQTRTSNYLTQASNALTSAQQAINSTQVTLLYLSSGSNSSLSALVNSSQLASRIANNLTAIASTVTTAGQTLSSISVAGASPFTAVGNTISSIGPSIQSAANNLQNVSTNLNSADQQTSNIPGSLNAVTLQASRLNDSITGLVSSVNHVQNSLPRYFNLARLGIILGLLALGGLGAIFLLIGLSILTLRRRSMR